MYGGSRAPSLLPKFSTDYVVHKEAVRQLFIDGAGNFLFDMKKVSFPSLPFCIRSYKFTTVKSTSEFVKYLENFLFGKKSFRRNDMEGKVAELCTTVEVCYEYSHHFDTDEEVYRNARNMTELSTCFKNKGNTSGDKEGNSAAEKKLQT